VASTLNRHAQATLARVPQRLRDVGRRRGHDQHLGRMRDGCIRGGDFVTELGGVGSEHVHGAVQ
jgi:hypothetical protein